MSINYLSRDIFNSNAKTIGHGCNTKGKMGAGIAREFKRQYPYMFKEYKRRCYKEILEPGGYYLYKDSAPWILNFATQGSLGGARLEYVEKCFSDFAEYYEQEGIKSLALSRIAAGLGGLDWQDVKEILIEYLDPLPINICVYEHYEPEDSFEGN